MSTIARQIAGASPTERLAEFQRIEPNLRKQFQEHLTREGRPGDFNKEFPAILEQAKERALTNPAFGRQASVHAANCQCESHVPAPRQVGDTARRIAGPEPLAEVDKSKVTDKELAVAMESAVKPKFVKWCVEEKVADAEAQWKAKLPKLTEDFKASKHFGRSVLAVRESIRRIDERIEQVKVAFDKWAATEGLSPEDAARQWVNVEAKAQEKLAQQPAADSAWRRANVRADGDHRMSDMRGVADHGGHAGTSMPGDGGSVPAHKKVPYTPEMGGWPVPHPSRDIGNGERKGRPGAGAKTPSPYGVNKKERKGIKKAADEIGRMEGKPSAKSLIDLVLEG